MKCAPLLPIGTEPYVITPPWSTSTAYDLNTGTIKWQVPGGDVPQAGPMRGNIFPKGGLVVTAGGRLAPGGVNTSATSKSYIAFALPKK